MWNGELFARYALFILKFGCDYQRPSKNPCSHLCAHDGLVSAHLIFVNKRNVDVFHARSCVPSSEPRF